MTRRIYRGTIDPVIAGCLDKIRRGEMTAVGVLADHLEEQLLPYAKTVRLWWKKCQCDEAYWGDADLTGRRFVRWQAIAWCRELLRGKIQRLFDRKWQPLDPKKYVGLPCERPVW
jgi:hypothetical protein